jgi:hypothetical protein
LVDMVTQHTLSKFQVRQSRQRWFERLMAIAAVVNLGFVVFDLTYVPWRDFWLQGRVQIPLINVGVIVPMPLPVTTWYDPIKGIEPHRDTEAYIEAVQQLEQQVQQQGLNTAATQQSLEQLRSLSQEMIETNPFQIANKSGTLEKIKNRMRDRIYGRQGRQASSRQAFRMFWSSNHLTATNWLTEIAWFNQQIVPLLQTNYYRSISETGEFTDNFGRIDLWFTTLFALEFGLRTFLLSRRYPKMMWRDTMLWRWYDVFLFFPFWLFYPAGALLRVIPVTVRLHQSRLVNMERVRVQLTQSFVSNMAQELSEAVVVQVLSQVQRTVRQGEIARLLPGGSQIQAASLNSVDEVATLTAIMVKLVIYQVLPKVEPELEALISHSIETVLSQSPAYQALKVIPGLNALPTELTRRVVKEVIQATYSTLTTTIEDPMSTELSRQLAQHFVQVFGTEIQRQQVNQELRSLLNDWLEELKQGYLKH